MRPTYFTTTAALAAWLAAAAPVLAQAPIDSDLLAPIIDLEGNLIEPDDGLRSSIDPDTGLPVMIEAGAQTGDSAAGVPTEPGAPPTVTSRLIAAEEAASAVPLRGEPVDPEALERAGPEFVADRARAEVEPLGLRAGTFIILPEVETAVEHTNNVFSSSTDAKDDVLYVTRPRVLARSDWGRHEVTFAYEGEYGVYDRFTSENPEETTLVGTGRLDVTRTTALAIRGSFEAEQESRGDVEVPDDAASPIKSRTYGLTGEASQQFNRVRAALRGTIETEDYDDAEEAGGGIIDNSDRNQTERAVGGRLTWKVSPATSVYADGEYLWRKHERAVDDDGFRRDAERRTAALGIAFEPTPLIAAEFAIGHVYEDYEDGRLDPIDEVTFDALLAWAMTPLTTVTAAYTTEVDSTTLAGASGSVTRTVSAGVDHELMRNLILRAAFAYEVETYDGVDLDEETVTASLGGEYWLTRNTALTAGYEHETQISSDEGDVVEDVVLVGLKLRH